MSEFSHLFRNKVELLLEKSTDVLQNWLVIVRQGQILLDSDNLIVDEFQKDTTLAKWLRLLITITDKEGKEPLKEAI